MSTYFCSRIPHKSNNNLIENLLFDFYEYKSIITDRDENLVAYYFLYIHICTVENIIDNYIFIDICNLYNYSTASKYVHHSDSQ